MLPKKHFTPKLGFWILIALLALTGVAMAMIVIFGFLGSVAYSIVWRVFVADIFLLASFVAQHLWLRRTAWVLTGITLILGLVNTARAYEEEFQRESSRYEEIGTYPWDDPWYGVWEALEFGFYLTTLTVLLLGFFSVADRWIKTHRVFRVISGFTYVSGLTAAALGLVLSLDEYGNIVFPEWMVQAQLGIAILALTAAAITGIAAFVQRKQALAAARGAVGVPRGEATIHSAVSGSLATQPGDEEFRAVVRKYVDEYLEERGFSGPAT